MRGGEGLTLLEKGEIGGFGCEEPQACSERPGQALGAGRDRERGRAGDGLLAEWTAACEPFLTVLCV